MIKKTMILSLAMLLHSAATTDIVKFDGSDPLSTWKFREVNDPVMGGQSKATFDIKDGVGVFDGTCAIVPKLKAPGFCSFQTTDNSSGATAKGIDARGSTHLLLEVKSDIAYTGFKVALSADNMTGPQTKYGFNSYKADFEVPVIGEWTTVQIPFFNFSSDWSPFTGEANTKCVDDDSVCIKEINKNHFSRVEILAEGVEGDFHLEVREIRAENMEAPVYAVSERTINAVDIATFDGVDPLTTWKWRELNDPVMGGKSTGSIDIIDNVAVFSGTCAIVDKLNAPGFCVAETTNGFGIVSKGIDASARSHLVMEVRSSMEYTGFKISLAANTFNPLLASFKANLDIPVTDDFITIKVPFTDFSNKWSSYTGEATVKCVDDVSVCISEKNKKSFANIGIWAEGVEGDFKLEVRSIRAENIESKEVEATVTEERYLR